MAAAVLQVPPPSRIREELQAALLLDPAGGPEEEVDENRIIDRYLVGLLAPKRQLVSAGELDELAVGGDEPSEDGTTDVGPAGDDDVPVVVGLTFSVDVGAGAIQIAARRGFHDRLPSARLTTPKGDPKARLEAPADRRGVSPRRAQAGAIRWMPAAEFPVPVAEVPLVAAYREWIRRQTARIDNPASGLGEVPRALELHDRRWHP